jgi:hypothetical protein
MFRIWRFATILQDLADGSPNLSLGTQFLEQHESAR